LDDDTVGNRDHVDGACLDAVPGEGPQDEIDAAVIVPGVEIVGPGTTMVVEKVSGGVGIVIDEFGGRVKSECLQMRCGRERPAEQGRRSAAAALSARPTRIDGAA
jgi:hypothetical protein